MATDTNSNQNKKLTAEYGNQLVPLSHKILTACKNSTGIDWPETLLAALILHWAIYLESILSQQQVQFSNSSACTGTSAGVLKQKKIKS